MIKCHLSRILGERKMKMSHLAAAAGISKMTVLSLYHEDAKGITFEVLGKLCAALRCQPGDLLEYVPDEEA
ncbi:MAG: helix-turn-helix transcriptional regulator [Firmicutes bacterium]|nr:helix-turn-helix transcriptional regulator [Bacillota bacterium]